MNNKESKNEGTKIVTAGTVVLWAQYSKVRQFFSKLFRIDLPANQAVIVDVDCTMDELVKKYNVQGWFLALTPKMQYSKAEKAQLVQLIKAYDYTPDIMYTSGITIINKVRPDTVPEEWACNMSILNLSKYYKNNG